MKKLSLKAFLLPFIVVMVLGATLLTGCITIASPSTSTPTSTTTPVTAINESWSPPTNSGTSGQLVSIADVVALVKPSVVAIDTEITSYDIFNRPYTEQGAGSGWIIDSNGIIVTNNHVVEGAKTITVTTDNGTSYKANMSSVFIDSLNDLAIIKIDAKNLPALKPGISSKMRIGDWVIAIGNALGQGTRATDGIISRKGVSLDVDQNQTLYDLIETSAAINPGNSGGPLVNMNGEVIGITSAKISSVGVEGMGYAISIDTALPIIEELVNKGYVTRPYLGVSLYTVDQLAISQLKLHVDKGVLVTEIAAGSPADIAGLKLYDVIVSIGGTSVSTVGELTKILQSAIIGSPLEIKYWRGSQEYTTTVIPIQTPKP
ncbi:MAG: S1C family serine protease [Dehalococcoidales bacterium]